MGTDGSEWSLVLRSPKAGMISTSSSRTQPMKACAGHELSQQPRAVSQRPSYAACTAPTCCPIPSSMEVALEQRRASKG